MEQFQKPVAGSIPTIIRTYKAAVTRRVQCELDEGNVWQRNYHETEMTRLTESAIETPAWTRLMRQVEAKAAEKGG
jgi:hypothetical protein